MADTPYPQSTCALDGFALVCAAVLAQPGSGPVRVLGGSLGGHTGLERLRCCRAEPFDPVCGRFLASTVTA